MRAENLCHQAILMNHASGAVAPSDTEVVQVGDVIWQRAKRRGLVQGAVRTVRVVATRGRPGHGTVTRTGCSGSHRPNWHPCTQRRTAPCTGNCSGGRGSSCRSAPDNHGRYLDYESELDGKVIPDTLRRGFGAMAPLL